MPTLQNIQGKYSYLNGRSLEIIEEDLNSYLVKIRGFSPPLSIDGEPVFFKPEGVRVGKDMVK